MLLDQDHIHYHLHHLLLDINKGIVKIGDLIVESESKKPTNYIQIKAKLTKGSYQLRSSFVAQNNKVLAAYYTEIEKL